jgi:putative ABC transport system permease protein
MPDWKQEIRKQLAGLRLAATREAEIVEELAEHLADRYQELLQSGATEDLAYRSVLAELNENELLIKELRRVEPPFKNDTVILGATRRTMISDLWQDLRYGFRSMRKQPGFTAIVILMLGLGIGANTAIFSVVNAVLLRPLAFKDPDRLIRIHETKLPQFPEFAVSPGNFLGWQTQNTVFESLDAVRFSTFNLTGTNEPERLTGLKVTNGFFATLGVRPQLGRDFLPEEDQPGHNQVALLSYGLWQRRFGGAPEILNQAITLDGQSYTVVGVMPQTFYFVDRTIELWIPMAFTAQQAQNHGGHSLATVGRLKPEVTLDQANAELSAIADRLAAQYPDVNTGWSVKLTPMLEDTVQRIKPALLILLGAVTFVLLIACANVANLLLARGTGRQKEIAIRTALGAGRGRIVRQLLTESLMLAVAGGIIGVVLAKWGLSILLALVPQDLPRLSEVSLDTQVLIFSAAISLLTGLVFGLIPALQVSKPNLNETMKESGRGSTEGRRHQLIRHTLVVAEVASALVLLVGAGLMMKSFMRLQNVDPGFNPERALTVSMALPQAKYAKEDQQINFYQQLVERVETLPGVEAVGATSLVPLSGGDLIGGFTLEGQPPQPTGSQSTNYYSVSSNYFSVMNIPLLRGRVFTERDILKSPLVVVINETMAKRMFPDDDPIGKRLTFDNPQNNPTWLEIVGVVGDVKHYALDRATPLQTYGPYTQQADTAMTLVVRTTGDPTGLSAAIRREVLNLDKEQPISNISTLEHFVSTSIAQSQFSMLLFGIFAALAMILACIGIYGVLNYSVTQRSHEIGIRLALGAQTEDVLRMVIKQGMLLAGIGIICGVVVAMMLAKLLTGFSELLYDVKATDPLTFAGIAVLLLVVAFLACYFPARRATKVDPMLALRNE